MKLKTLKEIECGCYGMCECNSSIKINLKQEAIKWIKEDIDIELKKTKENSIEEAGLIGARGIVKYFFNLTEEDLK